MTDKKDDLTKLENIAEFLHQEDKEVDDFFSKLNETSSGPPPVDPETSGENFPPAFETPTEEAPPTESTPDTPSFGDETPSFGESPSFGDDSSPFASSEEAPPEAPVEDTNQFKVDEVPPVQEASENDLLNEMVDKTMEHAAQPIPEPEPEPIIEEKAEAPPLKIAPDVEAAVVQDTPPAQDNFKETFQDVKEFASNISYGDVAMGGNPPFSIILKDVTYREDVDDIMLILKEHGLLKENSEETYRKSLERGTLLISHISEYSAIYLCHKLRRFHIDILMGLADDIHPPKTPELSNRGLVNKKGLRLNQADHLVYDSMKVDVANILTTTTALIESHEISRYVDTISEHLVLNDDVFEADQSFEEKMQQREQQKDSLLSATLKRIRQVKDLTRDQDVELKTPKITIKEIYDQLLMKMKIQAVKLKGNAVIGIQYQTSPLLGDHSNSKKYKITCTGTVVWAKRL